MLKSLLASQFVYILAPLPSNHTALDEINRIFYNFLWDGKGDKINRDIIISEDKSGGLRMIDIKSFNKALKSTWIKKYLDKDNHGKWKLFFDLHLTEHGGGTDLFKGNLNKNDLHKHYKISDTFLSEVLQIWSEISFNGNITSNKQFRSMNLWNYSLIKVGNSPIYYKTWATKGVREVRHLMKDENSFISLAEFKERFKIKIDHLTFHGIIAAIKPQRKLLRGFDIPSHTSEDDTFAV